MVTIHVVGFNGPDEVAPCTLPVQIPGPRSRVGWEQVGILFENPDVAEVRVWEKSGHRTRETLAIDSETYAEGRDWVTIS